MTKTDFEALERLKVTYYSGQESVAAFQKDAVNGRQRLSKRDLEDICKSSANIWNVGDTKVSVNGNTSDLPNGWKGRREDWENAKGMMK